MNPALQTLKSTLACVTYSGDKHTNAIIKETDRSAELKTVNIRAPNGDWFVFGPDKGRGRSALMSPLLSTGGAHRHHRACDAVIVVLRNSVLRLIFVELKSGSPSGFSGQFQSTRQFARYLLGLLEEFHALSFRSVEERFVLFRTSKAKKVLLNKRPTVFGGNRRSSIDPKEPQRELVRDGVTLYLKQLLV